jgi:hypothetical protein
MSTLALPVNRPPVFVRVVMRPLSKALNPLVNRLAGRRHFSVAAKIYHQGRRSGRVYATPASARLSGEQFWVGLTFGSGSDWCRNVLAADGCLIRWRGEEYRATNPSIVPRAAALAATGKAFKRHERAMMRMIGIQEFLCLDAAKATW